MTAQCAVEGCGRAPRYRGWCPTHYARWQRYGDVRAHLPIGKPGPAPTPAIVRVLRKVVLEPNGCWRYAGALSSVGYGSVSVGGGRGGNVGTHRVSYEHFYGPVPDGLFVLHSCDNPPCVNPAHLRAGTPLDNMRDRSERGRLNPWQRQLTHCKHGHPFTGENLGFAPSKPSVRICRTCQRERSRRYYAEKRAAA